MILLFVFAFVTAHILLFSGCLNSIWFHTTSMSRFEREAERINLRKNWLWTLLMFALAAYAGLML